MINSPLKLSIIISLVLIAVVTIFIVLFGLGNIDESICEEITDKEEAGNCFFDFAKINNDQELCKKVKDRSVKGECYYYFALEDKDLDLCDKARHKEDDCYNALLVELASEELCEEIEWSHREDCYYHLAIKTNDSSWCKKTYNREEECYAAVQGEGPDLAIKTSNWNPYQPRVGETLTFFIGVVNKGNIAAPSVSVSAFNQYNWGNREKIGSLRPNEEKTAVVTVYISSKYLNRGPHNFRLKVEPSGDLNPENNERVVTINVYR